MLNGEYKSYDKNSKLKFINVFNNGEYVQYKEYDKNGKMVTRIEYSKSPNYLPNTYLIYIYPKNGDLLCYYVPKNLSGHMAYGILADSTTRDTMKIVGDSTFATITYYLNGKMVGKQDKISVKQKGQAEPASYKIVHGHSTTWYYNGQKRSDGEYYYGKKIGEWHYWDKNGKEKSGVEKD